jgi:acyl-CoA dehydrogenase
VRTLVYGLTRAAFATYPDGCAPETRHYYKHVTRLSAAFAFLSDVSMMAMGGALKRKEKISGRLGDVLSMMYLVSAMLKHYEDGGRIREDLPLLRWAVRDALYHAQHAIDQVLSNFPVKALATFMRVMIFPLGFSYRPPLDARNHECAKLVLEPGAARDRLTSSVFVSKNPADATGNLELAFLAAVACEPIDRKLREAVKSGRLAIHPGQDTATAAQQAGILTAEEVQQWHRKEALRRNVIKVDDFPQDFGRAEIMEKLASENVKAKAA